MTLFGIDVSNHQGNFDFAAARREGFSFATHKISEGNGFRDPYWPRARGEMERHFAGRWGGYVYCRTNTDPASEARVLREHAGS
ncbi:MAG: GH25 family lysozyme, partial [Rhodococcus sp. (in: high G+C Gram-positive bacteria)]